MIYILLIIVFLSFIIFFTSTEISLISTNPVKIRHRAKSGDRRARQILKFYASPEEYVATILIGTNMFVVATTVVATHAFSLFWGVTGKVLTTFIVTFLILFFCEITPKSLSRIFSNSVASTNIIVLNVFRIIFFPLSWLVRLVSGFILLRVQGERNGAFKSEISRETIQWALRKTSVGSSMRKINTRMLSRIFQFSEKPVSEVMIPRLEIKAVRYPLKIREVLRMAEMTGLSRFPVYRKNLDTVIGILTIKDVFTRENERVSELIRSVKFVPPNKRCDVLMGELTNEPTQMVIVVNEFGETQGLVTLEDLVESLFGEIVDEFDLHIKEEVIHKIDEKNYLVRGLTKISEINEELQIDIPSGDYDTISGYLMDQLKEVPIEETIVDCPGFRLIVKEMDGQKIQKVLIEIE
jgi:putative hemolysin